MRFHSRQILPEIGLTYRKGEDLRATLLCQCYNFVDSIGASIGQNNYDADQLLAEFLWRF